MALTLEETDQLPDCDCAIRLCSGDQVLAERRFLMGCENDRETFERACDAASFADALSVLFPDFGTAPEGVAS